MYNFYYIYCIFYTDRHIFLKFVKAIFYVGKGKANRVNNHFKEAKKPPSDKVSTYVCAVICMIALLKDIQVTQKVNLT